MRLKRTTDKDLKSEIILYRVLGVAFICTLSYILFKISTITFMKNSSISIALIVLDSLIMVIGLFILLWLCIMSEKQNKILLEIRELKKQEEKK